MDFNIKKPTHILALLILLFTLFVVIGLPILSSTGFLASTQDIELTETYILIGSIITILIFLGTPFFWYFLVNKYSIKQMLTTLKIKKQGTPMAIIWAIVAFGIMILVVITMGFIITSVIGIEEDISNVKELASNLSIVSIILVVLFQSTSEEIFYRGFLLQKINTKTGEIPAIIISAIIFGIGHLTYGKIYPAILATILGIILGYVFVKTKNLNTAIIAHIIYNAAIFIIYYVFVELLGIEALIL